MEIARLLLEKGAQPNMADEVHNNIDLKMVTYDIMVHVYVGYVCDVWVVCVTNQT